MIRADQIVDEFWGLMFLVLKSLFLAIAWTANLVAMILFSITQRLYFGASWIRTYIETWDPIRPEIFNIEECAELEKL